MSSRKLFVIMTVCLCILVSCSKNRDTKEFSEFSQPEQSQAIVTFIELGSVNCVPCKAMIPVMEQIKNELGGQVDVVFHDVWTDAGEPFGKKYEIRVIPTQIFLNQNGEEYFRHEGYFPIEELYPVLAQGGVDVRK